MLVKQICKLFKSSQFRLSYKFPDRSIKYTDIDSKPIPIGITCIHTQILLVLQQPFTKYLRLTLVFM